jgi:hypothetical protein
LIEGAAHGDRDGFRGNAVHHHPRRQLCSYRGGKYVFVGVDSLAYEGGVDRVQGIVGFEKKIAAQLHIGKTIAMHGKIDDDELATGHLVFTVHRAAFGQVTQG